MSLNAAHGIHIAVLRFLKAAPRGRLTIFVLFVALALPVLPANAQERPDTRAERWREARQEKAEDLEPLEQSWFERKLLRAESGRDGGGPFAFFNFRPILGGLRSGAGTTAGLKFEPLSYGDPLYAELAGRASLRGYWGVEGLFGYDDAPFVAYGYARYRHLPQEDFYGVGSNTPATAHSSYRLDDLLVGGLAGVMPVPQVFVGGHASFLENRIGPGTERGIPSVDEAFTSDQAPGMHPGVSYAVAGGWLEFDTRDIPPLRGYGSRFSPAQRRLHGLSLDAHRGIHLSSELSHYKDLDGGDYGFSRMTLEAQQYIPILNGFQGVALRQFGSFTRPEAGDHVPFYMMQALGGVRSVRGFQNFRFRDLNAMLINAEYRWQVWHPLQLALFADAGHVFRRLENVNFDDLEASYGVGARVRFRGRMFVRLEISRSREGFTTYVNFGSFL